MSGEQIVIVGGSAIPKTSTGALAMIAALSGAAAGAAVRDFRALGQSIRMVYDHARGRRNRPGAKASQGRAIQILMRDAGGTLYKRRTNRHGVAAGLVRISPKPWELRKAARAERARRWQWLALEMGLSVFSVRVLELLREDGGSAKLSCDVARGLGETEEGLLSEMLYLRGRNFVRYVRPHGAEFHLGILMTEEGAAEFEKALARWSEVQSFRHRLEPNLEGLPA